MTKSSSLSSLSSVPPSVRHTLLLLLLRLLLLPLPLLLFLSE